MKHSYEQLKELALSELENLASQLRSEIIKAVSQNGGHLSSNLGVVELTLAMHAVFDFKKEPFIFDVSHQSYAHKILTGRDLTSLRQFRGVSGYTKPNEGDYFVAGHSSTSISLLVGACKAIALKNEDKIPVALIGDGAMSAGMVYEALNELGDKKYPCVIILNDNEMSISKPIGAISKHLSGAMASSFYQKFKKGVENLLEYLPQSATYMAKRFEESLKLITPGILFEEMGLEYIGVINGHDISELISVLKKAKAMKKPCLVHTQTIKGKGYAPAEGKNAKWHGVGAFDISTGEFIKKAGAKKSATELFSQNLLNLAEKHSDIVGVTAAMPNGTGLDALIEKYPNRFWDVAIAEQHAVTSMAAMAKEGFKPFIAIYSTFLQRAYDQVIHDCAIMNLNVVFAMGVDRGALLSDRRFGGADVLATSYTIAQGIKKMGDFDLILCGKQTTDGDTAQVGSEVSEWLNIPSVSNVKKISKVESDAITIEMDLPEELEIAKVQYPCLLSVDKDIFQPRLPSYVKKMDTADREIEVYSLDDMEDKDETHYGLNGSPTQVKRIFPPTANDHHEVWDGDGSEVADKLFHMITDMKFI